MFVEYSDTELVDNGLPSETHLERSADISQSNPRLIGFAAGGYRLNYFSVFRPSDPPSQLPEYPCCSSSSLVWLRLACSSL